VATKGRGNTSRKPARGRPGRPPQRSRPARRPEPAGAAPLPPPPTAEPAEPPDLPVPLASPEAEFATRVLPLAPERPRPTARRGIFLDVENTSRAQHLAQVIDHLAVDRRDAHTDLIAVANWRVVGHESARLLAQRGAQLVHSAPSTGVRDWSDLRIAVAAGIWLAGARPGDVIEIVSDDRAFDAVGDVAASLGIEFRRLSYRRLVKEDVAELVPETRRGPEPAARSRRRRRRRGRGAVATPAAPAGQEPRSREPTRPAPARPAPEPRPAAPARPGPAAAHTAPHDELVSVVRDLVEASPGGTVTIDAVANVLKARGFQRPPGSPRLITRLRRIREIVVSPAGAITLAEEAPDAPVSELEGKPDERTPEGETPVGAEIGNGSGRDAGDSADGAPPGSRSPRRRRRRRRGGRRPAAQGAPTT